ncbi:hypothetical protein FGB90_08590 [Alteribacter natronophilus]|nr:hypothetical protein FGB90_08590 [Alteribacter natronophilus]
MTGANDTALQFYKNGHATKVSVRACSIVPESEGVKVINAETRSASRMEAAEKTSKWTGEISNHDTILYKKIDSTMRGHIGAEVDAILTSGDYDLAVIAPSYPENGRTISKGIQYVNGIPLHQTQFAGDPRFPISTSRIDSLLEQQSRFRVRHISSETLLTRRHIHEEIESAEREGFRILTFDCQSQEELDHLVEAGLKAVSKVVFVGSAGLAKSLACRIETGHTTCCSHLKPDDFQKALGLVGSLNDTSRTQVQFARDNGIPVIEIDPSDLLLNTPADLMKKQESEYKNSSLHLFVVSAVSDRPEELNAFTPDEVGSRIANQLGKLGSFLMESGHYQLVYLTGGDIAFETCRSANIDLLTIAGELEEGIPVCKVTSGPYKGVHIITKAGGFGSKETIFRVKQTLMNSRGISK